MTRTQMGPNGEQQRVTVERDFRNEAELNQFLKSFEHNMYKSGQSKPFKTETSTTKASKKDDLIKPPGYVILLPKVFPKGSKQNIISMINALYALKIKITCLGP